MNRFALISIIVADENSVEPMNRLLHAYAPYIIGRMGLPQKEEGLSLVTVALKAPQEVTAALSGKLGQLAGLSIKTIFARAKKDER